ncbi:cytochrome P450, partial [Rhizobium leguminosarum]|uniref:cytochrome P450 n=1 Tax=Rhizobium leguminosarum TaxID=384 RepID=UPI003F95F316
YCVSNSPHIREAMEEEIDALLATGAKPLEWLDMMPQTRAAFEEALRLYPPAPSINRAAISDDSWTSTKGERDELEAGVL